jgi:hypothetical protein
MRAALAAVIAAAGLLACQPQLPPADLAPGTGDDPRPMGATEIAVPAPEGASLPMLTSTADGGLLLGWTEPVAGGHRIRFAERRGNHWSEPRTIAESERLFVNWADTPSLLVLPDGRLAAHWLVKTGPRGYDYEIRLATSGDGGRTWSPPVVPHRDGVDAEHGFVSLFPQGDALGLVWLDGRATAGGHPHDGPGATALRHASLAADGALSQETVIDARVCDCCQTGAAVSDGRVVVVYRDRGEDERRDISFARLEAGAWSAPAELGRDGWIMPACPVNGPQLAARGPRVAAAWFTSAGGTARVRFALSTDAGKSFPHHVDLDVDAPLGRVDVGWLADGGALVTWLRPLPPKSGQVVARRVSPEGAPGEQVVVGVTGAARSSGFPRLEVMGDTAFVAWTDSRAETPRLKLVALAPR